MHHQAPDQIKWYWIIYHIPAEVTSLPKNVQNVGTLCGNTRPQCRDEGEAAGR
jgi:hypothetical protein